MVEVRLDRNLAGDGELVVTDFYVYWDAYSGIEIECTRCSYKLETTGKTLNEINAIANDHKELPHG